MAGGGSPASAFGMAPFEGSDRRSRQSQRGGYVGLRLAPEAQRRVACRAEWRLAPPKRSAGVASCDMMPTAAPAAANEEVERLRAELVPKVKHMNEVMATVKTAYSEKKKMLKG